MLLATAACNFSTSQLQKVVRTCSVLYIFTSKRASHHSGVQFFDISTSKSGPELTRFVHFHFKMCFSPQRRAIFQHLNFKKRSENVVFCPFSLENVLLATDGITATSVWVRARAREPNHHRLRLRARANPVSTHPTFKTTRLTDRKDHQHSKQDKNNTPPTDITNDQKLYGRPGDNPAILNLNLFLFH